MSSSALLRANQSISCVGTPMTVSVVVVGAMTGYHATSVGGVVSAAAPGPVEGLASWSVPPWSHQSSVGAGAWGGEPWVSDRSPCVVPDSDGGEGGGAWGGGGGGGDDGGGRVCGWGGVSAVTQGRKVIGTSIRKTVFV